MSATRGRLAAALLATCILGLGTGVAYGQDSESPPSPSPEATEVAEVIAAVPGVARSTNNAAVMDLGGRNVVRAPHVGTGTMVEIPADPRRGVALVAGGVEVIEIGVPGAGRADGGEAVGATAVYTDAARATDIAAQPTVDGGVRLLTVLGSDAAPGRFRYPVEIPEGATLRAAADGAVEVVANDGSVIAFAEPAWAYDANQTPVPTHYEVNGDTVTQVIDHAGAKVAYPVVADPLWRINCGYTSCSLYISATHTRWIHEMLKNGRVQDAMWVNSTVMCSFMGFVTAEIGGIGGVVCGAVWHFGQKAFTNTVATAVRQLDCVRVSVGTRTSIGTTPLSSRYCDWK